MEKRKIKIKKSSIQDLIYVGVVLLIFAVVTLIAFKISDEINTKFQASDVLEDQGKLAYSRVNNIYPTTVDNSFLILVIGLCIVTLSLAMLVRVHPVFFVFYIFMLIITIFIAGVLSNIYIEMANAAEITAIAEQLTFITHIMKILPLIVGVFGTLLAIVMYKTWQGAQ